MKQYKLILLVLLVPVVLMGSSLAESPFARLSGVWDAKLLDRTWRLDQVLEEHYEPGQWLPYGKFDYVYDNFFPNTLDSIIYSEMGTDGPNDWIPVSTISFTYAPGNEYITSALTSMELGAQTYQTSRATYTYDNMNRLTKQLVERNLSFTTPAWETAYWTQIDYVSNTNFMVNSYTAADDENAEGWTLQNFAWDGQGRIVTETMMESPDSLTWTVKSQTNLTYHPTDTTTGDIFVSNIAHWLPLEMVNGNLIFNGAGTMFGNVTEETMQRWENQDWVNEEQYLYSYNSAGRLTEMLHKIWSIGMPGWENYQREANSYFDNGNLRYNTQSQWNLMVQDYDLQTRYSTTWGHSTANDDEEIPEITGLAVSASPNPFYSDVNIRIDSKDVTPVPVNIYNTRGQLVRTMAARTNSAVAWDGRDSQNRPVSQGVYFIRLQNGSDTKTVKILKMK